MTKIEIKKITGDYPEISFKQDDVSLRISYGGNLDLYFTLMGADKKDYFEITKYDYEVYEKFSKLYNDVIEGNVYDNLLERYMISYEKNPISYEEFLEQHDKSREILKQKDSYKELVNNDVITWLSDDFPTSVAPSFQIIKEEEDKFVIKFNHGDVEKQDTLPTKRKISVRICNSGSKYDPFNINFMRLFQSLNKLDIENNQMFIEEYLYEQKVKTLKNK